MENNFTFQGMMKKKIGSFWGRVFISFPKKEEEVRNLYIA